MPIKKELRAAYYRKYLKERRDDFRHRMRDLKSSRGCNRCSESDWRCLDWHHLDPSSKKGNLSAIVGRASWSWERIIEETAKCELLCANCHRKEEIEECIRLDEELPC